MKAIGRFTKIFLVFVFISTALALTISYIIRKYFEEEVTAVIVTELNKALAAQVDVKDINFSIISSFPRASLNFRNVVVYSAKKFNQEGFHDADKALVARSVSLRFNLIDLYYRQYDIKSIVFEDTHLWLLKDKQKNINYKIWNDSQNDSAVSVSVSLEKITADNIFLHYDDCKVQFSAFVDEVEFAGQYMGGDLSAVCYLDGAVNAFKIDDLKYVQRIPVKLTTNLYVGDKELEFSNTKLSSNNLDLDFDSKLQFHDDFLYSLNLKEGNTSISAITWFLPDSIKKKNEPYGIQGNIRFNGRLLKEKKNGPSEAEFQFFSNNLSGQILTNRYSCSGLVNVYFPDLRHYKKVVVQSEALKVVADENNWLQTKAKLIMSPWQKTKLSFDCDFTVTDKLLYSFIKDSTVVVSGVFSGRGKGEYIHKEKFGFSSIVPIELTGDLYNTDIQYRNINLQNTNCNVKVKNGAVTISRLLSSLQGSPIKSTIELPSVEPFFNELGGTLNLKTSFIADSIDLSILQNLSDDKQEERSKENRKKIQFIVDADVQVGNLIFDNHLAENVSGHLFVDEKSIVCRSLETSFSFGHVSADIEYGMMQKRLRASADLRNIGISEFLYEFENFGQDYLTDKNIEGTLSGKVAGTVHFTDSNTVDRRRLSLSSNVIIANGRLVDYEPVLAMSKYLRESELSLIEFDTIRNSLSIRNDSLFVPRMSVSSSIADFTVYGKQSLDNSFDYHVKVLLSKILSARRKKRKEKESFGDIADDGYGRTTVPLRISGTPDDLKIAYDRVGMKESVTKRWQQQNQELKEVLRKEFGSKNRKGTQEREKEEISNDFEFDWDE